jgi:hypothetical protein
MGGRRSSLELHYGGIPTTVLESKGMGGRAVGEDLVLGALGRGEGLKEVNHGRLWMRL